LAGLPHASGVEGESLAPLLAEPGMRWDRSAVSQWPRPHMGYTLRTERYRYTEWVANADINGLPKGTELYDYATDPMETVNLSPLPEFRELTQNLSDRLRRKTGRSLIDLP
jgi:iduronate 2-sulfatase